MNPENSDGLKAYKKIFSYIGMSARGRNIVSGEFSTENAIRGQKAHLVIVASDASDNTKKLFKNKTGYYSVPYYEFSSKEELGHILGKQICASLALTDEGLANATIRQLGIYYQNNE